MPCLGQFDRGVRKIAAALVLGDEFRGLSDKAIKLADGIAWTRGFDVGPDFVRLSRFVAQILDNQIVLRDEVAVERTVGARGLGDRLDPDSSDAVAMKEILGAVRQYVPADVSAAKLSPRARFRIFLRHGS